MFQSPISKCQLTGNIGPMIMPRFERIWIFTICSVVLTKCLCLQVNGQKVTGQKVTKKLGQKVTGQKVTIYFLTQEDKKSQDKKSQFKFLHKGYDKKSQLKYFSNLCHFNIYYIIYVIITIYIHKTMSNYFLIKICTI